MMKTMKYILFALVLFGLWVTEPMWRHTDTATPTSPVNENIVEQKKTKTEEVSVETRFLKNLELKFGPRPSVKESTGVPSSVYTYWRKTLQYPDSLQEETCSPIRGSEAGWTTVCRYRAMKRFDTLELREDRFIIKNGNAYKK
jgi:hypothetical protein